MGTRSNRLSNNFFHLKVIDFIAVKNCSILHERVYVMVCEYEMAKTKRSAVVTLQNLAVL